MLLTTRLKVGAVGTVGSVGSVGPLGSGAHCLWFVLITVVIVMGEPVRAHAPPRALYYGHRLEPREPFKHIPSALVFGDSSLVRERERLFDNVMPTCSQLRNMWKSSIKNLNQNNVIINKNNNLDSNEIPLILNNPYYTAFLWQQSLQHSRPHFGKIVSEPTVTTPAPTREDRPLTHHHIGKGFAQKTSLSEDSKPVVPIPGHFMDEPSQVGVVYGHVIHSPDEADDRRHTISADKSNHRYRESGSFGDFAAQVDDSHDSNARPTEHNNNNNNHMKQSSTPVKQQRTDTTNSFSTAEDFFKSGVWREEPVIPSVSFQRFH